MVAGRRGAMFGGQGQLRAFTAQVEIGVSPAVQFTGTAQGLSGAAGVGVFAGVMHQQDGQLELPLELAQIREQPGDLVASFSSTRCKRIRGSRINRTGRCCWIVCARR